MIESNIEKITSMRGGGSYDFCNSPYHSDIAIVSASSRLGSSRANDAPERLATRPHAGHGCWRFTALNQNGQGGHRRVHNVR
jgi:hypothetical protein